MLTEGDMIDRHTREAPQPKPQGVFSGELLDQVLAQLMDKDAESLLGVSVFTKVYWFRGGFPTWRDAGFPTE